MMICTLAFRCATKEIKQIMLVANGMWVRAGERTHAYIHTYMYIGDNAQG